MTVLSDIDIKRALVEGRVVCRPLRPENIKSTSIDLTLGHNFWRCDAQPHAIFNPYDRAEVERYFAGPFVAKPYASVYEKLSDKGLRSGNWPRPGGFERWVQTTANPKGEWAKAPHPFQGIPEDWPVIVLRPGERILAHSHEFAGIQGPTGTSMLKARSSSGRIGIKVCDDAGWGDNGFINRWTWEMRNDNQEAIVIPVGERMAQLVFLDTGDVGSGYGVGADYEGKYQQRGVAIDDLIERWSPEDMLPRCWKDQRQLPQPLDAEIYEETLRELAEDERQREGYFCASNYCDDPACVGDHPERL